MTSNLTAGRKLLPPDCRENKKARKKEVKIRVSKKTKERRKSQTRTILSVTARDKDCCFSLTLYFSLQHQEKDQEKDSFKVEFLLFFCLFENRRESNKTRIPNLRYLTCIVWLIVFHRICKTSLLAYTVRTPMFFFLFLQNSCETWHNKKKRNVQPERSCDNM